MKAFKAICAKKDQKIEIIVKYNSIEEAKEDLHKQGYSIIEIKEISEYDVDVGVFYFDAIINGNKKTGQIKSNDIFKAYLKLVDDLHYEIIYIYEDKNSPEQAKRLITEKIKESYSIYGNKYKEKEIVKEKEAKIESKKSNDSKMDSLPEFIKKELNLYYNLIDKILGKIDNIFLNYSDLIEDDKRKKLDQIYIALRQVKNITNINKLKIIGEIALVKIGEFETELILKNSSVVKQDILKETNKILRDLGSKKIIKLQNDDIGYLVKVFINNIVNNYLDFKSGSKKEKIDKNSYVYFKFLRELNIYKEKLNIVNKEILKATISFNKKDSEKLKIKKKLIVQNIGMLKNRLSNRKFSYIQIIKGFDYYSKIITFFLQKFGDLLLYSILIYSLFFIFIQNVDVKINYKFLYIIVILSSLSLIFKISKNIYYLGILSFLYMIFFIFLNINF
ncbi:MAG: hypothetical protein PHS92_04350 [Candidatus Gracilibacteria bacterium]|nr:hypothetical protein [Candidatus Gracilibacteria bacterium]